MKPSRGGILLPSLQQTLGSKDRAIGWDSSHWEGPYDPSTATEHVDFGFTKLTQGTYFLDNLASQIWEAGMKDLSFTGLFHYQTNESWLKQGDFFLKHVAPYPVDSWVLDVEPYGNTVDNSFLADVRRIITYWRSIVATMPVKPLIILYTNQDILQNFLYPYFEKTYPDGKEWLDACLLWYAQYWLDWSPDRDPGMAYQREQNNWLFYQYTEAGPAKAYGFPQSKALDLNVFNGSPEDLKLLSSHVTIPPEGDPMTTQKLFLGVVKTSTLNVRKVPTDVGNIPVTKVYAGETLIASEKVNGWWKLTHIMNKPVTEDLYSYEGATKTYIQETDVLDLGSVTPGIIQVEHLLRAPGYPDLKLTGEWKPDEPV
jgi:GH25 family lysozyme M1 (1,4-beta-N-acetylmuramidase)